MFRLGEPTISAFYASVVRLRMGDDVYIVDGNGRVIYHPDPARIGEDLSGDRVVGQVLAGQVGALRVPDRGPAAHDVVVAFAPVPGTPWGLVTEKGWSAVANASRGYGRVLLGLLVLGVVMPSIGFGLLAYVRRGEAVERAQIEQQLRVARLVQQTQLPEQAPELDGWQLRDHYQPAQAVGGDFYDFFPLADGRLGLVIGDVTDKGVPAALVMATTRALLRTVAAREQTPGRVLERVNDLLREEIPPKMFVTCLYAILDPATGRLRYANAGHSLPLRAHPGNGDVRELRATGMPLGLMPGMVYEEREAVISPGECVLFHSDGLVEAHNPQREMFGGPRLRGLMADCSGTCPDLIARLLAELARFAGRGWEQEDDVTLVAMHRNGAAAGAEDSVRTGAREATWRSLASFSLPSEAGSERQAIAAVVEAVRGLDLPEARLARLKTAVGEATMNAVEHGNRFRPELPVEIDVRASSTAVAVRISDRGPGPGSEEVETPDIEAKVAGRQSPRGWGRFLIEHMVDRVNVLPGEGRHTVELILMREGDKDASATS
jgi:anti-sigma regulatory factor (Ser/Thr protein kinase)